jgi:hypothetical protein
MAIVLLQEMRRFMLKFSVIKSQMKSKRKPSPHPRPLSQEKRNQRTKQKEEKSGIRSVYLLPTILKTPIDPDPQW